MAEDSETRLSTWRLKSWTNDVAGGVPRLPTWQVGQVIRPGSGPWRDRGQGPGKNAKWLGIKTVLEGKDDAGWQWDQSCPSTAIFTHGN